MLNKENIIYKENGKVFSTPNRLVLCFKKIEREIHQKSGEIRGPNSKAPNIAIEGFLKSNLQGKADMSLVSKLVKENLIK